MTDADYQFERLQAEVELKRATLYELRGVLFKLQTELEAFADEYESKVGRLEAELEGVQREIQAAQRLIHKDSVWGPGIGSFQEYLDSRRHSGNEPIKPIKPALDETETRALYRKLARKYHPDTTTSPEEKARLSVIMARINAAYGAREIETLRTLEDQPVSQVLGTIPQSHASGKSSYQELLELSRKLDDEIGWTKDEHKNLMGSSLMNLKIECSILWGKGRDLLSEMAAQLQGELDAARAMLDTLRRG